MSAEIEAIRIGTRVKLADGVTGLVTAVCIRNQRTVNYEVAWWNGRDQRIDWFSGWQLETTEDTEPLRIGFNNAN